MDMALYYTQSFSLWKCHRVVRKVLGYRKWLSWFSAGWGNWCRVASIVRGDQRQCQDWNECADKWCQALGDRGAVLSHGW